jgi:hypothetical protein
MNAKQVEKDRDDPKITLYLYACLCILCEKDLNYHINS